MSLELKVNLKTVSLFVKKLLPADEVLQSYARNLRAPALNCVQDDRKNAILSNLKTASTSKSFPSQK